MSTPATAVDENAGAAGVMSGPGDWEWNHRRRQRAFGPKCARFELPVAAARPSKTARETRGPTLMVIGRRLLQFGVGDDVVLSTAPVSFNNASTLPFEATSYAPLPRHAVSFGAALAGPEVPTP